MDIQHLDHEHFIREAIQEAERGFSYGQRPIGCVIVHNGQIISRGHSMQFAAQSRMAHAEMEAMSKVQTFLYEHGRDCFLYTTMEPCPMCLGTIVMNNIRHVVFGSYDLHAGSGPMIHSFDYVKKRVHSYIGGILKEECEALIEKFSPEEAQLVFKKGS